MRSRLIAASALALTLTLSGTAPAQNSVDGRVTRLESEMRAVQRRVFPGGAGQYLQPEVEAQDPATPLPGAPAGGAVVDLTARVGALEGQMASLTGQVEQAGYRARTVQEAFDTYRRATDARLHAIEAGGAPPPAAGERPPADDAVDTPAPRPAPRATPRPTTGGPGITRPIAAPADPARIPADPARAGRVAAVERPSTGNATEDAYTYGYRLWQAHLYPEAEAQLKLAAAAGPGNRRYTFAQNLLGRAYLDDNKPSLASMAFYDNYKRAPDGERAPESLYYLAQALQRLNKPADACKVYDEMADVYANRLTARQRTDMAAGRVQSRCPAPR
ncbi:hypothetical protein [Sphingomonas sp.]|uniref:tetratricopeptide repeat protein n=1 Tax=Sphingomonas sp. TaxID=28214 RepID=UPI003CC64E79